MDLFRKFGRRSRRRRYSSNIFLYSKIARWALFGLIGVFAIALIMFFWYGRDLPTPGKLINTPLAESTRIYDRNGILLYSVFQDQNRTYVKLSDVPKYLQEATIAIEDKDFYKNQGFSITGYLRAARNLILSRRIAGGGSTITQQLVKNVLLTSETSFTRKIKELILAIQVDKTYSKDQILEMYLNDVPYGGTNIGVEAAAESYFGKHAKDLNLAESAFLAGLPQSPSTYSPFSGHKYYIDRSAEVFEQMQKENYITQKELDQALKEVKNMTFSQEDRSVKAPHFVMYVKELLAKQFGENMVDSGLQVTTTLDYKMHKEAEKIVHEEISKLENYHVGNGAAVVTDPKTGEILAMVGSEDYFNTENDGNFNVALANRQPGSSLKPIMYATAFEKGYTPATMIMDVKTDFPTGDPENPIYTPVNYDGKYKGPVQLRFALGNSINIPAVKMLARVGIKSVMQTATDMGITNWEPTSTNMANVGLSLVLGGRETTLLSETTAYGVFATGGIRHDPISILKVVDSKGNTIFEHRQSNGQKVLSSDVSFLISHILLDNVARTMEFGPNSWLVIPGKTVSVKTGTTDKKRDNWTIGYTPSYVVGVWVGNNDNSPMNEAIASGVTGASPIWNRLMSFVLKGKPDEQPQKPDNVNAMMIDAVGGGLPVDGQPTRSEYFIKGTEPTGKAAIYQTLKLSKHRSEKLANADEVDHGDYDTKNYIVFYEDDPVSTDGQNRWQQGIDAWIRETYSADHPEYYPPTETSDYQYSSSPTSTPTPTITLTPTL